MSNPRIDSLAKQFPAATEDDLEQLLELNDPEIYHNLGYTSFEELCKAEEERIAGDLLWDLKDRQRKASSN